MPADSRPTSAQSNRKRRAARYAVWATRGVFGAAAIGAVQFVHAPVATRAPFAALAGPSAWASGDAFGTSREVKLRFTLPSQQVEFPLSVAEDPTGLEYQWVSATDTVPVTAPTPLVGATVTAPERAGFYQLVLLHHRTDSIPAT